MLSFFIAFVLSLIFIEFGLFSFNEETENFISLYRFFSFVEIIILTGLAAGLAFYLDEAGSKSSAKAKHHQGWIPWLSVILFSCIVIGAHFLAWVPVVVSSFLALPCVLLPPLTYRVTHPSGTGTTETQSFFSLEENCRIQDRAFSSYLIKQFRDRYPDSKAYIYKGHWPHSAGGLLLHNKERLFLPRTTYLEITLDCPFTTKVGILAEGREIFKAYLSRPTLRGYVISPMPQSSWEEWLTGLRKKEWFERIKELDTIEPEYPDLNNLPYQFSNNNTEWQPIKLT